VLDRAFDFVFNALLWSVVFLGPPIALVALLVVALGHVREGHASGLSWPKAILSTAWAGVLAVGAIVLGFVILVTVGQWNPW
jgi:hypothetical protein